MLSLLLLIWTSGWFVQKNHSSLVEWNSWGDHIPPGSLVLRRLRFCDASRSPFCLQPCIFQRNNISMLWDDNRRQNEKFSVLHKLPGSIFNRCTEPHFNAVAALMPCIHLHLHAFFCGWRHVESLAVYNLFAESHSSCAEAEEWRSGDGRTCPRDLPSDFKKRNASQCAYRAELRASGEPAAPLLRSRQLRVPAASMDHCTPSHSHEPLQCQCLPGAHLLLEPSAEEQEVTRQPPGLVTPRLKTQGSIPASALGVREVNCPGHVALIWLAGSEHFN